MANQPDIQDVIKNIQADVTTIVKGEIELAKAELLPQAKSVGIGAGMFGGAGYFGLNAVSLLFIAASIGLGGGFSAWFGWGAFTAAALGFVGVAILALILAGVLAMIGKSKVSVKGPEHTVEQGQRSVEAVKSAVERGREDAETEAAARQAARKAAPSITSGTPGPDFNAPR